jgi:hypothetical protein
MNCERATKQKKNESLKMTPVDQLTGNPFCPDQFVIKKKMGKSDNE